MAKTNDISNQRFNKLVAIKPHHKNKRLEWVWLCRCDCGKDSLVTSYNLLIGHTKSCGCLRYRKGKDSTSHKHGDNNKRIYDIYYCMYNRCYNKNNTMYENYGGRGIKICDHWLDKNEGYVNFKNDMGEPPKDHSIDRINNNLGYSPENCRWATSKTQSRNMRNNINYTYKGKTACISEWAETIDISVHTLYDRVKRLGWSFEKAITTPVKKRKE